MLSVVILTKNEEEMINDCLKQFQDWADEIIVIDDYSSDKTLEIAKKHTDKIYSLKEKSFAQKRNFGKAKAKEKWLLYIDADERLSSKLKNSIRKIIARSDKFSAYQINRINICLGKELKHTGYYPDYVARLFLKDRLSKWEGELHEHPLINGEIGKIKEELYHFAHRTIASMVLKTLEWSEIEAKMLYNAGHPEITWWRFPRIIIPAVLRRLFWQQGFRDGAVGWIESLFFGFSRFLTYARLWEMQKKRKND